MEIVRAEWGGLANRPEVRQENLTKFHAVVIRVAICTRGPVRSVARSFVN